MPINFFILPDLLKISLVFLPNVVFVSNIDTLYLVLITKTMEA